MKKKLALRTRLALCVGGGMVLAVLFFPIWRIELNAPQYPEGLALQIWDNGVRGDVDIINGLNHYIGMKTIHSEDFVEFKWLPKIIICFAGLFFLVALLNRRAGVYSLLILFLIFGVLSMIDFWNWLYDYGHNLNPEAAIKVPGMSYQPPLIGFKQLLNFGAYSVPDVGGMLFIGAGVLLAIFSFLEFKKR